MKLAEVTDTCWSNRRLDFHGFIPMEFRMATSNKLVDYNAYFSAVHRTGFGHTFALQVASKRNKEGCRQIAGGNDMWSSPQCLLFFQLQSLQNVMPDLLDGD
jgi:hypothetical protein